MVLASAAVLGIVAVSGCGGSAKAATQSRLPAGLFAPTAGSCTTSDARPSGSYLIVISAAADKAVKNPKSRCANHDYTPLRPGTDGGLALGRFQSLPNPVFDAKRNSTAGKVFAPVDFGAFAIGFATTPRDEQDAPSGAPTYPVPAATVSGSTLNVDLRSLVVTYAGPPNSTCRQSSGLGCWELGSRSATGTYDAATRHFVLDWFAGQSFTPKGDSVEVHLEGTFVPGGSS
jgi:hypothetical protein